MLLTLTLHHQKCLSGIKLARRRKIIPYLSFTKTKDGEVRLRRSSTEIPAFLAAVVQPRPVQLVGEVPITGFDWMSDYRGVHAAGLASIFHHG